MEKENKIETVNQKSGMTGLETATFIVTLISAALSILFTFIALCAAQDPYFGGVQAMSIIRVLAYAASFTLYVITLIVNKKVKFDINLVLFAVATVMVF